MKKITKMVAMVLAAVCVLGMMGCGESKSAETEIYQGRSAFVEAGYEGDCVNDITTTLLLNGDNTYTIVENTSVCQVGGIVVAYWTYTMEGTYTEDSSDDASKTITLSDAETVDYNMNGSITTSAEDDSLLDYGKGKTITLDTTTSVISE